MGAHNSNGTKSSYTHPKMNSGALFSMISPHFDFTFDFYQNICCLLLKITAKVCQDLNLEFV